MPADANTSLRDLIAARIRHDGPLSVADYMALCLGHPQHGYYMKQDPFGRAGDFITAPEISQMFGELCGVWAADAWQRLGSPSRFHLVECGPGRGTLMRDALRATAKLPGFHQAMQLHLVEMSPTLRGIQSETLAAYAPQWHDTLTTVPQDAPLILIANEFLDALPARQYQHDGQGWHERRVGLDPQGRLTFGLAPVPLDEPGAEGDVVEKSSVIDAFMAELAARLKRTGGAALLIDYGHAAPRTGDTFRALANHRVVDPLAAPGDADLSFHVDFSRVAALAEQAGLFLYGPVTQGDFLKSLGIGQRLQTLLPNADERQRRDLQSGHDRLTDPAQMGDLFKVVVIGYQT